MDPLSLDWGGATAEFQNDEAKSAVHMFAHDLTTAERAERSLRFARARLAWCGKKMAGFTQEVWFDEREQKVAAGARDSIRAGLKGGASGLMFMSEGEA
ncbi:MAG TPA: hypothetical protein VJB14_15375 [Planctomycetota bacterium]|nr:hypothetical protein [Planctomycetota bacterium]